MKRPSVLRLSLDLIEPPEIQLRGQIDSQRIDDLANSMARVGLINPITVRKENERYKIVAGHRRYLAARRLGWQFIDARIVDPASAPSIATSLHENLYRENLTPMEEAALCEYLVHDQGMNLEEAARAVSHSPEWVERRLNLTRLHPLLQEVIHTGDLSIQAAEILNGVDNEDWLLVAVDLARKGQMGVKTAIEYKQQWDSVKAALPKGEQAPPPAWEDLKEEVEKTWCDLCGSRVWLRVTKLLRVCFDCIKVLERASQEQPGS